MLIDLLPICVSDSNFILFAGISDYFKLQSNQMSHYLHYKANKVMCIHVTVHRKRFLIK